LLDPRLARFLIVGLSNTLISFAVFQSLLRLPGRFSCAISLYQLISYSSGILWSFLWNRRFTFRARGAVLGQGLRFVSVQIVFALASALAIGIAVERFHLPPTMSWIGVMALVTLANFIVTKCWVFNQGTSPTGVCPADMDPGADASMVSGTGHGRNARSRRRAALLAGLFLLALTARTVLLFAAWSDLRHGSAAPYASAAIGLSSGAGLTINQDEIQAIAGTTSNLHGDFLQMRSPGVRQPFTEFLPGPALALTGLWCVFSVHNFLPLLLLQILLEALAISALFWVLSSRCGIGISIAIAALAAINPAAIKRTLMMGYDFWPQFGVMVLFTGVLWLRWQRKSGVFWALVGTASGLVFWFRELALFLPFFVAMFCLWRDARTPPWRPWQSMRRVALFLLPVVVCLGGLSLYRLELTGSSRPTRSTFWHTFFAGVGQFSNPYGLKNDDNSVWEFGKRIDPELANSTLSQMYQLPDSPYERALQHRARELVFTHPWLCLRNMFYRWGIMVSPLLYRDGDLLPTRAAPFLLPFGLAMLPIWVTGLAYWRKSQPDVFWLSVSVYLYFLLAFGWFYVNGRVIIPYIFIAGLVYLGGCLRIYEFVRARLQRARQV
jgi:putative flippase GtrA